MAEYKQKKTESDMVLPLRSLYFMKRKKTFLTIQNASVIKEMTAKILQGVQGGQMTSRWAWHSMVEALGKVSEVTSLRI